MVRTILFGLVIVIAGAAGSIAASDTPPDLVGIYRCTGLNPDGTQYEGVVEIAKLDGTFRVIWVTDGTTVMGVGIYSGGVFAASYFGGAPAVAVYKVEGDRLVGEWTIGGLDGAVYTETLTKIGEGQLQVRPAPRERQPERRTPPSRGVRL